ncbi:acyl-CoA reductase [Streptomyces europaeiscabiei]|uniref:acyl-CoA reductase n=1 Tax=Streptomyces europaeiscabiei TaxID=146819 RepID=UPI002E138FFB|nr:hypothetical protein OHB30_50365 [Streptomyces europaeiscabiei]
MTTTLHLSPFYWQGTWVDGDDVERLLASLRTPANTLTVSTETVIKACERLSSELNTPSSHPYMTLRDELTGPQSHPLSGTDADRCLQELAEALDPAHLRARVLAELGTNSTPTAARGAAVEEAWYPVGTLVHIAPSNVAIAGILSVVEGLLAGNLNVVKISGRDSLFTHRAASLLADLDPTGEIRQNVIILRFPSTNTAWLRQICCHADAIAVWGTEEAVTAVTAHAPAGSRVVDWGPKLSLAYIDNLQQDSAPDFRPLAGDILRNAQRSCSSPQIVYVNTTDDGLVFETASRLAQSLAAVQADYPPITPTDAEQAEITNVVTVASLEQHLDLTRVISATDGRWHVLADTRSTPDASPLYGTIWVKPLPSRMIHAVLHPMRRYLQTIGLHAEPNAVTELSDTFFKAGALRITPLGAMQRSYPGEPHDGVLALQRYSRRVSRQSLSATGDEETPSASH